MLGFYVGGVIGLFVGIIMAALIYRRNRQHGDAFVDKITAKVKDKIDGKD